MRRELFKTLEEAVKGEVRYRDGDRALYATDSSNYRQVPLGLVIPRDQEDVLRAVEICRRFEAPILTRGGGTSLAGQTCNAAVVFDMSKHMNRILSLDFEGQRVRVEPGIVLDSLHGVTKPKGLRFGPDPSTHNNCTIGGMIGNNACGMHSVQSYFAGHGARTSDNIATLEILTYDGLRMEVGPTTDEALEGFISAGGRRGEIYAGLKRIRDTYGDLVRARYPKIPRRVSGYNLDELLPENGFNVARALAGTEGTCVLYLAAELLLIEERRAKVLVVLGYDDVYKAADHVPEYLEFRPDALEGFDDRLMQKMRKKNLHRQTLNLFPDGDGWLILEFGGSGIEEAREKAEKLIRHVEQRGHSCRVRLYTDELLQRGIWQAREEGLGATAHVPGEPNAWEGWEDSAVAPERLGEFLRDFRKLFDKYGYSGPFYGHFGQGLVHTRIDFDLKTVEGVEKYRRFTDEASDLVVKHGGSLSGEHGDGQSRGEWLYKMYGEELVRAFEEFKALWDPANKMNPHKVVRPYRVDENLRLGPIHQPRHPKTFFKYPEDAGSFTHATERCVGVGKCRRLEGGAMCPSYMATRDEMHATRGRAHLLFELMRSDVIGKNGWRDEVVREALDMCLACKACKAECPVNVDMATYKAEFFAHYYKGRLRPTQAYAMGYIDCWARIASRFPRVTNIAMRREPWAGLLKRVAGLAPERKLPTFARTTLRKWYQKRGKKRGGKRIILWPDTFNNYLSSNVGQATVEALEMLGYEVDLPRRPLCCGRPLYDFGLLGRARKLLLQILDVMEPEIRSGVTIVGMEPSCVAVFRDELKNLFPDDDRARLLSRQVKLLSEFLDEEGAELPQLEGRALVHLHCHQKSVLNPSAERRVLDKLGLDYRVLDSGCCGMAGSFGFEAEKYDVSVACAERALLPELRTAEKDVMFITNGFSCREQVEDLHPQTQPLHLAEVLRLALKAEEHNAAAGGSTQD